MPHYILSSFCYPQDGGGGIADYPFYDVHGVFSSATDIAATLLSEGRRLCELGCYSECQKHDANDCDECEQIFECSAGERDGNGYNGCEAFCFRMQVFEGMDLLSDAEIHSAEEAYAWIDEYCKKQKDNAA